MWYHIKSLNETVNLNLITRIVWQADANTATRLYFLESEYDNSGEPRSSYVDIRDGNDRISLRKFIFNDKDTWKPSPMV